jgi:uncharacterized protein YraI
MYGKKFITLVVSFGLLLALIVPTFAQDASPTPDPAANATPEATPRTPLAATTDVFVSTDFRVNIRSGPGTEYTILDRFIPGDTLDITGQNAENNWLRVNFNGQEGWVSATVIQTNGVLDNTPIVEAGPTAVLRDSAIPTDLTGTTPSGDVVIVTQFNTNLRSTTSLSADVLDVIPFDTQLQAQARSNNSNWVMVTFGDQSGWVWSPILDFTSGQVEALPVMATETDTTSAATQEASANQQPAVEATVAPTTAP